MTTPAAGAGECVGHIVGLLEGDDDGAFGGVHGMQRLDAESDAGAFGVGENFAEAVEDSGAGIVEGLAVGGAGDDDEDFGVEGGGLLDGEAIVGDAGAALCGSGRGEPAAAAEAGDAQAGVTDEGGRLWCASRRVCGARRRCRRRYAARTGGRRARATRGRR